VRLTKVDSAARRVFEVDGQSPGKRLSEITGFPPEELTIARPEQLFKWCLAMKVGREYFLRAVAKNMEDDTLVTSNMLEEDQELEVMRTSGIVTPTQRFFTEELPRRIPRPTAALFFECGVRKLFADMTGQAGALGGAFTLAPKCAGFVVEFETYCGFMINSTLTSLVFGSDA